MADTPRPARPTPKTAVISGGSSGIGLACARILCMRGYDVTLLARDEARLENARRAIRDSTGQEVALTRATASRRSTLPRSEAMVIERRVIIGYSYPHNLLRRPNETEHSVSQMFRLTTFSLLHRFRKGRSLRRSNRCV